MIVHGRTLNYVEAGSGPVLLLIHGMAGNAENWRAVVEPLARAHTVIAPDLPGHGESEPGGGDYSLGSLATGLRDLLVALGHERATLVGHSLGGGIAMQFTYQFPELVERLVLVSSGGLGPEVSMVLRAAALPGADLFISATAGPRPADRLGPQPRPGRDRAAAQRRRRRGRAAATPRSPTPAAAAAFLATLRSVVGTGGQRVAAGDRLYLAESLPILIVWGSRDPIIPVSHGEAAHADLAGSRLEIFDGVGHLPQLEAPGHFVLVLERFLAETEPAKFDRDEWRARFQTA